jgi:glycosyltransferase involved in cell wall biosynthesis
VSTIEFLHSGRAFSGIESATIELAEALAKRGHDVHVFNNVPEYRHEFGVSWWPFSEAMARSKGDIGIAVANPNFFRGLAYRTPILWAHNPMRPWTQIRRGSLIPLLKTRPSFVMLGTYHESCVPRWLPSAGRTIIHHGVKDEFFRPLPASHPPPPRALYTSAPYRGLDWVLELWGAIKRRVPDATLDLFSPKLHQAEANAARIKERDVTVRGSVSRAEIVRELAAARVQIIPGHADETYCLAAAEAIASGVPVITRGIGALAERVQNGKTGFVAPTPSEFIERTIALLTDDSLWMSMHRSCLAGPGLMRWEGRAQEWERLFAQKSMS